MRSEVNLTHIWLMTILPNTRQILPNRERHLNVKSSLGLQFTIEYLESSCEIVSQDQKKAKLRKDIKN